MVTAHFLLCCHGFSNHVSVPSTVNEKLTTAAPTVDKELEVSSLLYFPPNGGLKCLILGFAFCNLMSEWIILKEIRNGDFVRVLCSHL